MRRCADAEKWICVDVHVRDYVSTLTRQCAVTWMRDCTSTHMCYIVGGVLVSAQAGPYRADLTTTNKMQRPFVISIANQKGGVGKTTTTVGIGESLARRGYRVLVIDFDGQANLTAWVLGRELAPDEVGMHDVLRDQEWGIKDAAEAANDFDFDFVGSNGRLYDLESEFADHQFPQYVLQEAFERYAGCSDLGSDERYDFCLIDCPPALGLAVTMALCASDGVLVPTKLEAMSIQGLGRLIRNVEQVRKRVRQQLQLLGIVATQVDKRRRMTPQIDRALRQSYGNVYLKDHWILPRTTITEASALSVPIYAQSLAKANEDYKLFDNLADELLGRIKASKTVEPSG